MTERDSTIDDAIVEAKRFLGYIGDPNEVWHFQTFPDRKKDEAANTSMLTSTPVGAFHAVTQGNLQVLNSNGAGVFVAINQHDPSKRRTKKTTTAIRAIFADFDDVETSESSLKAICAALPPTLVIESSPNKYHVYYVLDEVGQIAVEDFAKWQRQLIKAYGSDVKITDSSRVMRIAGFIHQKGEPFRTRIMDSLTTGKRYRLDALVSAFYGGRNNWLTSVAGGYREKNADINELKYQVARYNGMLDDPLLDDELDIITGSVEQYELSPHKQAQVMLSNIVAALGLETTRNGAIIPSAQNTLKVVEYEGGMRTNTLTNQIEAALPVSWHRATQHIAWTDLDDVNYRFYLITKYQCDWPVAHVTAAVEHVASMNCYDPLLDYLNSVVWDGVPRVETVFHRHLATVDNEYTRAVAKNLFIGAVKRAYDAGCKHDSMVVLVGEEGSGKSRFSAIIAKYNEFFTDSLGDLRNKDGVVGIQGKWIIEFGELKSMQGASAEHTKAFLSTQVDNIRLPYGKRTQAFPRRCIFIGTTNNNSFITDTGTNRRMLPIYTPLGEEKGQHMDPAKLEAEVDQLWAEAVHLYRNGETGRMPYEVMALMMQSRLEYTEDGGYTGDIIRYMNDDIGEIVNGKAEPREWFIPREFYMATVVGASQEKWVGESRLHKQIQNSARKVFAMPEWSAYTYGRFRHNNGIVNAWKKK